MSQEVQEFSRLCVQSGGTTRHRWNEQAVQAMVWQLFVPQSHFLHITNFTYGHKFESMKKELLLKAQKGANNSVYDALCHVTL